MRIPTLPERPSLAVRGTDSRFEVRRIYCVGRNYAEHAREMGADPEREPPFFFAKPADAIVESGATLSFPKATADLHHEIELVVAIGGVIEDCEANRTLDGVFGYAVGLDMTRRDLQAEAKAARRPWDMAKGFDQSAPISAIVPADAIGHPKTGAITLSVNGENRQTGDLAEQIWSVPDMLAYLSRLVRLEPGDLVMTGTPAGVGPVRVGDRLQGAIEGIGVLEVSYR